LTQRGFLRLAVVLPLFGMAVAAAVHTQDGDALAPSSATRGMIAYLAVGIWAWQVVSGPRLPEAMRRLWYAPLLYVAFGLALLGVMAVTHEGGVKALAADWRLVALRSGVKLGLGYAYVALIQWAAAALFESAEPSPGGRSVER
jgi:hypothetical protein